MRMFNVPPTSSQKWIALRLQVFHTPNLISSVGSGLSFPSNISRPLIRCFRCHPLYFARRLAPYLTFIIQIAFHTLSPRLDLSRTRHYNAIGEARGSRTRESQLNHRNER